MYTETELKYMVTDFSAVRAKLLYLKAELHHEVEREENTVYDLPDGLLSKSGVLLRLREYANKTILTVKEKVDSKLMKVRREHETELSISFEDAEKMLVALKYRPVYRYRKTRETWILNTNVHVALDVLPFGRYVEVEAASEKDVAAASSLLGFDLSDGIRMSYRELQLRETRRQHYGTS